MPPDAAERLPLDWKTAVPAPKLRSAKEPSDPIPLDVPRFTPHASVVEPERITAGAAGASPRVFHVPVEAEKLEAALFKNRADLKLMTSQVAMHLSAEQRRSLFSALDRLLDVAHWEDESSQINIETFRSYLRFTIYGRPRRIPNLGVSPNGTLLAGWHKEEKSVHVEFFAGDQCMALIRTASVRGPQTFVFRGHVADLRRFILNNGASSCID